MDGTGRASKRRGPEERKEGEPRAEAIKADSQERQTSATTTTTEKPNHGPSNDTATIPATPLPWDAWPCQSVM